MTRFAFRLALAAAALLAPAAHAQTASPYDPDPLPQAMTAAEQLRRGEIGRGFAATPPPAGARPVGEFERSEAVLVRYPLGVPLALVAALSEHVRVITLVSGAAQRAQAASAFAAAGVAMARVDFLDAPTNSIWTRDYGPFFVAGADRRIGLVDFAYNRPRPDDDAVPAALGAFLGLPVYAMPLVHTGGNYMADGRAAAASTSLVWAENGGDAERVRRQMADYLGVATYHVRPDPQASSIEHIDTSTKFLGADRVLLAQVPQGHPRYAAHEAAAAYYAAQTSAYGTPYQVFRVQTPAGQPYANALIVNERVYVPVVNAATDAAALAVYRAAMPGYDVRGIAGSWLSTDALHCRVKEVVDRGLLALRHTPPPDEIDHVPALTLGVDIVPHSGQPLVAGALHLIARVGAAPFDTLALAAVGGDTYSASVPVPAGGGEVAYYFSASDASGRTERMPLVGPAGARTVRVRPATVGTAPDDARAGTRIESAGPNPARGDVSVRYTVAAPGAVRLEVLDVLGRRVALLRDGVAAAGPHGATWAARSAPAGLYLVRLTGRDGVSVRRVTVAL